MESKEAALAGVIKSYEDLGWRQVRRMDWPGGRSIEPGDRMRHSGHQWPEAFQNGTGEVLAIMRRHDDEIEVVVQYDDGDFISAGRVVALADYRVCLLTLHK